jgi:hypothetical protein
MATAPETIKITRNSHAPERRSLARRRGGVPGARCELIGQLRPVRKRKHFTSAIVGRWLAKKVAPAEQTLECRATGHGWKAANAKSDDLRAGDR